MVFVSVFAQTNFMQDLARDLSEYLPQGQLADESAAGVAVHLTVQHQEGDAQRTLKYTNSNTNTIAHAMWRSMNSIH